MEYVIAGQFTFVGKAIQALKRNLIFYIVCSVLGVGGVVGIIVWVETSDHRFGYKDAIICLSNIWGLFLVIFLLGYGLVAVPRNYWRKAFYESRIKYHWYHIAEIDERRD